MGTTLREARPLPGYRLELSFQNGSSAVLNMAQRVNTLRFSRLSSEETFKTARAQGDRVVWTDGADTFGFYCSELLDVLLLD